MRTPLFRRYSQNSVWTGTVTSETIKNVLLLFKFSFIESCLNFEIKKKKNHSRVTRVGVFTSFGTCVFASRRHVRRTCWQSAGLAALATHWQTVRSRSFRKIEFSCGTISNVSVILARGFPGTASVWPRVCQRTKLRCQHSTISRESASSL